MIKKEPDSISWKVAGEAGHGILNAGLQMFAKSYLRSGFHVFATAEYPSLIRGGHNNLDVRVSRRELYAHTKHVDILVALDKNSIDKHANKIASHGGLIYDTDSIKIDSNYIKRKDISLYPMPMLEIANKFGGRIMRNTVAMGATFALTGLGLEVLFDVLRNTFAKKGDQVINANIEAAKAGHEYLENNFDAAEFPFKLKKPEKTGKKLFMSGNEATTAGAIKAGCKFLSAYPMTPATSVLTNMASQERNYNIVVKHTEDEIAAINMAIGASYAGVRAMTCTSGGGFALMAEGLGLAAQTETPVVIVEAQRPGPGTGMATHSSQGDLNFVLNASTDEFPRIVMAPGDVEDCFYMIADAFNLAEKYQMPVIFLTDKYLGESYRSVPYFDTDKIDVDRGLLMTNEEAEKEKDYKRYRITKNGISPRAVPGQKNCMFVASSYEHDEKGFEREEEETRVAMHNKRFRKLEEAAKEIKGVRSFGNGDIAIISWGSTKGPIREAMRLLDEEDISAAFHQVLFMSPFPTKKIEEILKASKKVIVIENNKTGQLAGLIRKKTGLEIRRRIAKYDGRPFSPEDIRDGIKEMLKNDKITVIEFSRNEIIDTEKTTKQEI
jgi:2-oxoglutarate ferredoxin oxidoreductase subunit alpha